MSEEGDRVRRAMAELVEAMDSLSVSLKGEPIPAQVKTLFLSPLEAMVSSMELAAGESQVKVE
jgi:hypothetical protein